MIDTKVDGRADRWSDRFRHPNIRCRLSGQWTNLDGVPEELVEIQQWRDSTSGHWKIGENGPNHSRLLPVTVAKGRRRCVNEQCLTATILPGQSPARLTGPCRRRHRRTTWRGCAWGTSVRWEPIRRAAKLRRRTLRRLSLRWHYRQISPCDDTDDGADPWRTSAGGCARRLATSMIPVPIRLPTAVLLGVNRRRRRIIQDVYSTRDVDADRRSPFPANIRCRLSGQ